MAEPVAIPVFGEVFADPRGDGRTLRATWHPDAATVVLSIWRGGRCVATHQLPMSDVARLVQTLVNGLAAAAQR